MKKIIITGFEPFGGDSINASWEAVKQLKNEKIDGVELITLQLPCVFKKALVTLTEAIDQHKPTLVISVGEAGGRVDLSFERIGINIDDARIPDNEGNQPIDETIVEGAPAAYFATYPIKAIVHGLQKSGIPASVSQTAGTFLCNHVLYGLLHHITLHHPATRGGFVHIPHLPEQAIKNPGRASMPTELVVKGLKQAIEISLVTLNDITLGAGATH